MTTPPHRHLIPAIRSWMLENYETVHLKVDPMKIDDIFLRSFAVDGVLTLSVTSIAVDDFQVVGPTITFSARFGGRKHMINIPATSVISVDAFDGKGENYTLYPLPVWGGPVKEETPTDPEKKPFLRVVK